MGDKVVPFRPLSKTARRRKRADAAKGATLCRHGHHKWVVDKERRFDVKQGKLVTVTRCARCGLERVTAQ